MKKILSLLFVLSFSLIVFAQKTVTGIITDTDGKALASASVTIEEPGKNAILAYGISNAKGEYKVTFTSAESNLDLKIKAFNQKPITQSIKNDDQKLNFSLDPQATEIQEVRLKTKLITKKGDTISYDLKSFENKNDRTLADVLKKIPGIEVNKDGTVLYQGEAINKFYVNGKDLMEGGYGTINNSLPKDAVSKVEVLENHQPVSILRDKVPSEQAALNIKLKKSVTMTGRGEVGAGFSPLLWNVKLTPMFFGQKNQWVINYKANNNGESVEKEGNLLSFGSRWEGRRSQTTQKSWLNVESADTPNLPEKRYLLNNVHFVSANLLTSPFKNKEWELKANASYTNNAVERVSSSINVYEVGSPSFTPGGTITSSASNNFYTNAAKGELIFTKNAKKGFFKNTTTWNGYWNDSRADVIQNTPNSVTNLIDNRASGQSLESPTGSFQNSLSTIIPWKDKLFNVMSYFKYQKDRQTLEVNPASYTNFQNINPEFNGYDKLRQYTNSNTLEANHSLSVGFNFKKWTLIPEVGINMNFNRLNSALYGGKNDSFTAINNSYINDVDWNEIQSYTQVSVNYKSDRLNLNVTLPYNFYGIAYKDHLNNKNSDLNKSVFEPTFFASYDFASFFKYWVFASQNYNFGSFGYLYGGKMLTNPLSISLRSPESNIMPQFRSRNIGTRLEYRNPLNNLFFNVRYNYGTNRKNILESFTRSGLSSNLALIDETTNTKSQTEGAEIGKYFPKFKSNLSLSFTNTDANNFFKNIPVGVTDPKLVPLTETTNNIQTLTAKFNNAYFSWFSIDYNISMNWNQNYNKTEDFRQKSSGWNHNLAAYIYPSDNHTFGFNWDDISSSTTGLSFRNSFYDLSYQYTWVKRKIDFEFKWLNIANRKLYETVNVDTANKLVMSNQIYIRPSQFMFTVKFNFK